MKEKLSFKGAIFDMDGVITKTAKIHARAWKGLFDDFLKGIQGEEYEPFDIEQDYKRYIDGKPRLEGISSFLVSRDISLEEGNPESEASLDTIHGLGKRKNESFLQLLEKEGAEVYLDTIEVVKRWKGKMKLAVISSSKNCKHIMESAGVLDLFDIRVDGITSEKKNLKGKPEPDIFFEASKLMGIEPAHCLVFEDAIAGVKAGKKGEFGLVIGVARDGEQEALINSGADFVVESLENIDEKIKSYA
ncbi:MAG: beta-phosphoglucomutase family hydrolase [Anditalea sp.]